MAKALLCHPKQSNKIVLQQMPLLTDNVSLVDFFGKYSWTLFQLLNVDNGFSKADLMFQQQNSGCITTHNFVKNQNVASDASEHALNLLTVFNTGKVAQTRKQQDYLRSIFSMLRQTVYEETATSC